MAHEFCATACLALKFVSLARKFCGRLLGPILISSPWLPPTSPLSVPTSLPSLPPPPAPLPPSSHSLLSPPSSPSLLSLPFSTSPPLSSSLLLSSSPSLSSPLPHLFLSWKTTEGVWPRMQSARLARQFHPSTVVPSSGPSPRSQHGRPRPRRRGCCLVVATEPDVISH